MKTNLEKRFDDAISSGNEEQLRALAKKGWKPPQGTMLFALINDHPELLPALKELGAEPNEPDGLGETALGFAITDCSPEVVETLFALGADPSQESLSIKPLSHAVLVGKEDHVVCLLSHGANPNEKSQSGSTALLDAVRCGYPRIVELLLKAGADPFQKGPGGLNAVELAASSGESNVKDLFRKLKKPPQKAKHAEPITALFNAIEENDKITFEKRLSAIKDVNQVDSRGPTALDLAIRKENASFVRSLLKAGANPNGVGENRGAPLEGAVRQNRLDLVQILIKAGADPDGAGIEQSPLFAACEEGNAKIADFLIQSGATVNAKTLRGQTPLMFAVVAQSLPVVELLLARGADVNVVDDRGQTALFDAVIRSLYQIKITTISSFGSKARNEKISDERVEIIKHLLRAGANARQKDKEGRTPRSYCGDAEISDLLKSAEDRRTNKPSTLRRGKNLPPS